MSFVTKEDRHSQDLRFPVFRSGPAEAGATQGQLKEEQ